MKRAARTSNKRVSMAKRVKMKWKMEPSLTMTPQKRTRMRRKRLIPILKPKVMRR